MYDSMDDTKRAAESIRRSRRAAKARKLRRRRLFIRRAIIVLSGLLIVFLAVFLLVVVGKAIFNGPKTGSAGSAGDVVSATVSDPHGDSTNADQQISPADNKSVQSALSFKTPNIHDDGQTVGHYSSSGGVYIYDKIACELFGWSESTATDYAKAISEFKEKAPEYTVYNMVIPNHTEFALPRRLIGDGTGGTAATSIQSENIEAIYKSYTADVQPINCYNALCDHIDEYIYFNTDHHWSGLGAYYAYTAFCEQTGQTALSLSDCEEHTIPDFEGTLTDYDESLSGNLDTVHWWQFPYSTHAMRQDNPGEQLYRTTIYYEDEPSGPYSYGVFIWGDAPLFVCYNDELSNGKKIAVIKESYGNSFAPYLTNNYEEVHVIDFRYFQGSLKSYMQDNDIDEVIFVNNVMSANTALQVDRIREIF